MIVSKDGYEVEYHPAKNRIVITMPQTWQTLTNTMSIIRNRKIDFTDTELALLLELTRFLCEREEA